MHPAMIKDHHHASPQKIVPRLRRDNNALVQRAQTGDNIAFEAVVTSHYPLIFSSAYRCLGNRSDAEDVAQLVCMRLSHIIQSFDWRSTFRSWLYRITLNAARDLLRAQKRRQQLAIDVSNMAMVVSPAKQEDQLVLDDVWRTIHSLPEKQRDALLLVYGEHMSYEDAAAVMGCEKVTVAWHVHKARKLLRQQL